MEWLPTKFSKKFRVVVTVSPNTAPSNSNSRGSYLSEFERRGWEIHDLGLLDDTSKYSFYCSNNFFLFFIILTEIRQMFVEGYLGQFGKKLSPGQMTQILDANQTSMPVFLKAVLDELLISFKSFFLHSAFHLSLLFIY